ncbi:MarR family winged helix-turn-helix transcriptional regulator [Actinoplanes sp. NPDC051513]|uniref:MarR family winged helix-turn-helix transcriptional regulator n=1 Tax=Actinoplanes sp. NPDC051513 TaxID=3363908 RepID=UPI003789B21E
MRDRLGYLMKHAQLALTERTTAALAPLGINGRELAVLTVLGDGPALAQQQAAGKLNVDRTTMVDLVDALERKGLVERRSDPADRRRNLVHLTTKGQRTLDEGERLYQETERALRLTDAELKDLKDLLRRISTQEP